MDTFKCVICGELVSKRKSVQYKNGRACKTHEIAVTEMKDRISEEHCLPVRKNKFYNEPHEIEMKDPRTYCWHCEKEAVTIQQFSAFTLSAMNVLKERNIPFNIFFPSNNDPLYIMRYEYLTEFGKYSNPRVVVREIEFNEPDWKFNQLVIPKVRDVAKMIKAVYLCPECIKEYEIKVPEPNFEQIRNLAVAIEVMKYLN